MEFNQLRTFLAVAQTGNITQAAETLYLTQPAISRQIQSLEGEFGVKLFERTSRGMQLTDAGAIFRGYADRCLTLVENCRHEMADVQGGGAGRLVIGVGGTHPMYELPYWISSFTTCYPSVDISIRTGRSREIIDAVYARQLDLAFIRVPVVDVNMCYTSLFSEQIVIVSSPALTMMKTVLTPKEFQTNPLILFPSGTSFRAQLDTALQSIGVVPWVRMETDSVEEIRRYVALGIGLAFLPEAVVKSDIESGHLVNIGVAGLPLITRPTSLIYLRDHYQSTAMREFVKFVVNNNVRS